MSYLNSVTIIGFVGADPQQRQARNNNGSKFTVLSVATQWSWKNTDDEWASKTEWHRVCVFRPRLAEYAATTIKKGSHVLVVGRRCDCPRSIRLSGRAGICDPDRTRDLRSPRQSIRLRDSFGRRVGPLVPERQTKRRSLGRDRRAKRKARV